MHILELWLEVRKNSNGVQFRVLWDHTGGETMIGLDDANTFLARNYCQALVDFKLAPLRESAHSIATPQPFRRRRADNSAPSQQRAVELPMPSPDTMAVDVPPGQV